MLLLCYIYVIISVVIVISTLQYNALVFVIITQYFLRLRSIGSLYRQILLPLSRGFQHRYVQFFISYDFDPTLYPQSFFLCKVYRPNMDAIRPKRPYLACDADAEFRGRMERQQIGYLVKGRLYIRIYSGRGHQRYHTAPALQQ